MSAPRRPDDDRRIVAGAGVLALLALASVVVSAIVCVALLRGSNSRYADVGARTRTISQDVREVLMAGTAMHMRFESLLDPDGEPCLDGADGAEIETFVRHGEELARSLSAYVPGGALSAFTGALADSAQSVRDAQRWRDLHDAFGGIVVADDALRSARAAVDVLRSEIVAVEGRRRLARVLSVRGAHLGDERFIESSDSLRRAIIAAFSATDVVREIDEIGLLVERLGRERGVDNLANLRDNQLRLAHRRLDECLARHESPDMQALRAQVPALCRVLYGDGWRDDEAHECVVPGEGGLFRVRERWLELSAERDRIAELGATHLGVLDGRIGDLTRAIDELLLGVESAVRTETDAITTQWTIGGALAAALLFGASFALLRRVRSAVAELRASREAALEASRAKSAFVANISHEIRTPMNGVLGIAELLEHTPLNAEQRRFVGTIRSSGGALMSVLNDVLDFSKLDAQQMRLEAVSVSPAGLVEDVVALFGPKAEANGVTLEARVAAVVPPWVVGDPTRIRQVLFNLVGNAIKFTERGSIRVDVDATPIDGTARFRLRFTVVDTGPGIEPSTLERLFAPFAQSDDSTTRRFGGTGLGLVICRRLLDLMGGRITVESVPGEGSAFSVEVPCAVAPAAVSAPPRRTSIQASTPHAIDVLVVEDNAVNQMVVARMLAKLGARVHVVGDGAAAVAAITARAFDLVLMDCHMPGMDGFEATRRIRASEGGEVRTPIVALTASALDEDQRRCDDAGMDGFLGKPVTSDALAAALTRHARGGSGHDPRPVAGGGPTSPSSERP